MKYTSKNTNTNKLPRLAKDVEKYFGWPKGAKVLDIGCGKFKQIESFLLDRGLAYYGYDPYHLSDLENQVALHHGPFDIVIVSNVLNVIKEPSDRKNILQLAHECLKVDGTLYVTVYEGDRSGEGRQSKKDCWQNNKKTIEYIPEIEELFACVERKYRILYTQK